MSNSVRPHRRQPTRLPRPWDSPGKNTGVGCHFLLQCMKVKRESEVAQSCPTRLTPMDCSLPGSFIHGIFQARVLEWVPLINKLQILLSGFVCITVLGARWSEFTHLLYHFLTHQYKQILNLYKLQFSHLLGGDSYRIYLKVLLYKLSKTWQSFSVQ